MPHKRLSKDFTSEEFACPCCGKSDVSSTLITLLQKLRDWVGEPLFVSKGGGVRCKKYNDKIGGHSKSAHLLGKATDISFADGEVFFIYKLATMAKLLGFTRIGLYPFECFIHVDVAPPAPSKYWMRDRTGSYKYFRPPKTLDDAINFCKLLPYG